MIILVLFKYLIKAELFMRKLRLDELGRLTLEDYHKVQKLPVVVVLDNIRSLYNVGAVFRTADAFRISQIYLCGITARPPHREIQKTALGATESVKWQYFESTSKAAEKLKEEGYRIFAIEQTDESEELVHLHCGNIEKLALVFGNEVNGVSEDVLPFVDACIEIAQYGTKHSLNVSVSAGIIIWHVFSQMKENLGRV
jgi:tRNA G18 (ribose-2'-O)-methylase SpoU